jgi:hypothetical protein
MLGRAKYGLGLITVGALAAALAPLAGATLEQARSASAPQPNAIISTLRAHGKVNGTIVAVQPTSNRKARVSVSLHHLTPHTTYVVAASTTECSHAASSDSRALRLAIKTSASGDDAFKSTVSALRKPVTNAKSVRIYQKGLDGTYQQVRCGIVDNADVFQ